MIEKYGLLDRYSPIKRGDSPYVSIELGMVVAFRHGEALMASKVIHGLQWDVGVQEAGHECVSKHVRVDVIEAGTPSGGAQRASDIQVGDQALSIRTAVFSDNGPVAGLNDKVHALANDLAKDSLEAHSEGYSTRITILCLVARSGVVTKGG